MPASVLPKRVSFFYRKSFMSEQQDATPVFQIQRVYLKDLSLEQPNSPAILTSTEQPSVDIQLAVGVEQVVEGITEVSVTATVTTKIQDKVVFLVEAKQAGIFEIRNLPEDQMGAVIGIACPQIIYPYLRGNVADTIQRAGFPPVHLAEINFQAMYEQQQQQAAEATKQ
jgi:preprotein translocase subunit SecB